MSKDINGYPQIELESTDTIIFPKNNKNGTIELKPATQIIYGGAGDLQPATQSRLGGIKVGNDLSITNDGILTPSVHIENLLQNSLIIFNCGSSNSNI